MIYMLIIAAFFSFCSINTSVASNKPQPETRSQTTQTTDTKQLNAETAATAIALYDALRTIEDDLDRLDLLNRSNEDINAIRSILEKKKSEVLVQLSKFKGFERLAAMSHKQHFTSKIDNTVPIVACYTLATMLITALVFSTINISEKTVSMPSQTCVNANITLISNSLHQIASTLS